MISRNNLKKLAEVTLGPSGLEREAVKFVLSRLSRGELSVFLLYFEKAIHRRSAYITSAGPIPQKTKESFADFFKNRLVFFDEDATIGEGFCVSVGDMNLDLSLVGYFDKALNEVRKE